MASTSGWRSPPRDRPRPSRDRGPRPRRSAELSPHHGRLFGHLHDDVTPKLAFAAPGRALLRTKGVSPADVLGALDEQRDAPREPTRCVLADEPARSPADRPLKVTDRLAAFLLGEPVGAAPPVAVYRHSRCRPLDPGRASRSRESRGAARGPGTAAARGGRDDALALLRRARPSLVLVPLDEAARREEVADPGSCRALEDRVLCFEGSSGTPRPTRESGRRHDLAPSGERARERRRQPRRGTARSATGRWSFARSSAARVRRARRRLA